MSTLVKVLLSALVIFGWTLLTGLIFMRIEPNPFAASQKYGTWMSLIGFTGWVIGLRYIWKKR